MLAKVRRWGNGLALRVHKRDLESAGVAEGDVVQVELIRYRVGFAAAKSAGVWMRTQKRLQVAPSSRSLLDGSWGIFRAARGRLSYPDAVVLAWCRERRATPLAFDRAILRRVKRS